MDRRAFLRRAALSAAVLGGAYGPWGRRALAQDCEVVAPPGVQLYTLREPLASDARGTLAALGALGIREVEAFGLDEDGATLFGLTPTELKAALDEAGLAMPLAHVGDRLDDDAVLGRAVERARVLGVETLVVALPREFTDTRFGRFRMVPAAGVEPLERLIERFERVAAALAREGLGFGYHNHHVELVPVPDGDGGEIVPYEHVTARMDPELVRLELDLGWLAAAGRDPVAMLERHAGRVVACHLKDYVGEPRALDGDIGDLQERLVEPGAGGIDFAAVLAAMAATRVPHGFIEIDVSAEPMAAVERGHAHLQALRPC
ncbi:MAG TPA: sugar phosphate isomerase/epimerase [Gammaproteobacteria bacterium]